MDGRGHISCLWPLLEHALLVNGFLETFVREDMSHFLLSSSNILWEETKQYLQIRICFSLTPYSMVFEYEVLSVQGFVVIKILGNVEIELF
jgi:hypothetical protein